MTKPAGLWASPREWALDLAVAAGIGVFLGLVGPFGSFPEPLGARVVYFVTCSCVALTVLNVVTRVLLRASARFDLPVWAALAASVAVGAVPLTAILLPFSVYYWPGLDAGSWASWYGYTLVVAEPAAFFFHRVVDGKRLLPARPDPEPASTTPAPAPERGARFVDRLPQRLGRNLLCLQMEDHYVRAHTDLGSDLILTPLKSAMAELTDIEGLQVHRSWWVARRAVAAPIVNGRNYALRLTNGLEVPVSRTSVAKARAMGLL